MPLDPRPDFTPDWPTCRVAENCRGIQHGGTNQCFVHNHTPMDRLLSDLDLTAGLDLRGVELSAPNLSRILARFDDGDRIRLGDVRFNHAWFSGDAEFDGAAFGETADFSGAWFCGSARFNDVTCAGRVSFTECQFDGYAQIRWFQVQRLALNRARFARATEIDVWAEEVYIDSTRFEGGVVLRVGTANVFAGGTHYGAASMIAGDFKAWDDKPAKLWTLTESDVSNLVLTDMDLSICTFVGAHRLDQLRIDGRSRFAVPPKRLWFSDRRVIDDERNWRGWSGITKFPVDPARVAALYRSLRKSFEDSKNAAEAGDFYYGEMEMRRHSEETSRAEKAILWCYWLLSGYGQRAARAVAALVVLVVTVATLLIVWGQPFGHAARIAVGAVVFRDDRTDLTEAGEWTVLTARFLGPVLLALAVLAIRARVKR